MDITLPAIVTVALAGIGFIIWLVRLEGRANTTSDSLKEHKTDQKETNQTLHGMVTMTNSKLGIVEHSITEIRATAVTRHDLKDLKDELNESINSVGDRTVAEVERLVAVISKSNETKPRASTSRTKSTP